jgi:hypothetical protein
VLPAAISFHPGLATGLLRADITSQLGLATGLLLGGFAVGVYGHMSHSRTLILVGIAVIAAISLWLVGAGEVSTF